MDLPNVGNVFPLKRDELQMHKRTEKHTHNTHTRGVRKSQKNGFAECERIPVRTGYAKSCQRRFVYHTHTRLESEKRSLPLPPKRKGFQVQQGHTNRVIYDTDL
mmetsp:Transcript_54310/g.63474  ORF Transcript_54310/g.63474 Transcript_54310/m.63474 type:complete len:104 (-) Transcript_54310:1165-1476(-)